MIADLLPDIDELITDLDRSARLLEDYTRVEVWRGTRRSLGLPEAILVAQGYNEARLRAKIESVRRSLGG